ncbi:hypothetical protein VTN02DRAFT_1975 [Thermoascus thermophilus]
MVELQYTPSPLPKIITPLFPAIKDDHLQTRNVYVLRAEVGTVPCHRFHSHTTTPMSSTIVHPTEEKSRDSHPWHCCIEQTESIAPDASHATWSLLVRRTLGLHHHPFDCDRQTTQREEEEEEEEEGGGERTITPASRASPPRPSAAASPHPPASSG